MSDSQRVIPSICFIMMLRQFRPSVSYSFTSFFHSEFFQMESSSIKKACKSIDQANVPTTNFLWAIAPLFVLLFPAPDSFRCKSVIIYNTVLELFRSYLFYMSSTNSDIKAALPQVSPLFEMFFSTTSAIFCIYLYTKVNDRTWNQKITLYVIASILIGAFINTYFVQLCSTLKIDYFEMNSNYMAVPILIFMLFILIPQPYKNDEKQDLAALHHFIEKNNESKAKYQIYWSKFWRDFIKIFEYSDVRKWSVCWWLNDTLLIGITKEFTNIMLKSGSFANSTETLEWVTWINSLGLLSSAVIIAFIAHSNIIWKKYINWIPCTAPFYYVGWSLITGSPPLWMISSYYTYCSVIFQLTFAISISQLAKYVPTDKHIVVFCFNSMISLALKMAVAKASEIFYFTDVIFKTILIIGMVIFGKSVFSTVTSPENTKAA